MNAATTTSPTNFYALARNDFGRGVSPQELKAVEAQLQNNPIARLPGDTFREQLRLMLACTIKLTGSVDQSRSQQQLAAWLDVLDGTITSQHFFAKQGFTFFTWEDLAKMDMEPMAACCYMRMARDAQAVAVMYKAQKQAVATPAVQCYA